MPLEDEDAYWRQYYGMGRPWAATARNRTGCLVILLAALTLVLVILLGGLVMLIL
jgi:hypothetical protein